MNLKRIVAGTAAVGLFSVGFTGLAMPAASAAPLPVSASTAHTTQVPTLAYPKNLMPLSYIESRASFNEEGATLMETTKASSGFTSGTFTGYDSLDNRQIALVGYGAYSASGWKKVIAVFKKKYGAKTLESSSDEWLGTFTKDGVTGYISASRTVRGNHITIGMILREASASTADSGRYVASSLAIAQGNYMYDIGM